MILRKILSLLILNAITFVFKGKKQPPPRDDEQVIVTKPANFGTGNLATKIGKLGKNDTKIEV